MMGWSRVGGEPVGREPEEPRDPRAPITQAPEPQPRTGSSRALDNSVTLGHPLDAQISKPLPVSSKLGEGEPIHL